MSARAELDAAERGVEWIAWPDRRTYGPGLTAEEVAELHNRYLRSGYNGSSGAYHNIRVAPAQIPSPAWAKEYPSVVAGRDPWADEVQS